MEDKKLFLLDAYALIYRAYYALMRSPRVTSDGRNTSAIFGFCNTLDDILRKENPPYMAVCFDPPHGRTFRHDMYAEYKANRDKQPEDITFAIPYIKEIVRAYGIRVVEVDGYEADDVIGTLATEADREGSFVTYMMTPDKDYGQLVSDRVLMYRPALKGRDFEIRGPREVCERYGISTPKQVIDLLALEGDASDNVPGCPGVGEKTASKLVAEWGSVENLLEHSADLKGALRKRVENNAEQILFSKKLVTICTEVPVGLGLADLARREPDVARLETLFRDLEFRSFLTRLRAANTEAEVRTEVSVAPTERGLFDEPESDDLPEPTEWSPVVAESAADVSRLLKFSDDAGPKPTLAISVYAVGDEAMTADLYGIAFSTGDGEGENFYVPLHTPVLRDAMLPMLAPLFNASAYHVVASHDVKRDMIILRRYGIEWTAGYDDTGLLHYLVKPEARHELADVAVAEIGYATGDAGMTPAERRKPLGGDLSVVAARICRRADAVRRLSGYFHSSGKVNARLYDDIELPLVKVLAEMEWTGVRIDTACLDALGVRLRERMAELESECYRQAGAEFNVASPAQVGEVLFERLAIDPKAKKTKTGAWSTTEEILEGYADRHPVVRLILEIRGLRKLLTTYIEALPRLINPHTGKIHTTFNQTATATGRLSSTNPNLQNIPIRTPLGREVRAAFVADPGCLLMSADYSQIELRLMADMSGDEAMLEAFASGEDIHRATAARIFHKALADVSDDERRAAKTANFGIIYGISAFGLSQRLGIPRGEAKALIDGYLATYPGVASYMTRVVEEARRDGFVSTPLGRRRYLPDIMSRNAALRGYAERNAVNAPLQGAAADIIKLAMVRIASEMERRGLRSRMILQVHDELVFNVVPAELDDLRQLVIEQMSQAGDAIMAIRGEKAARMEVGVGEGQNWLEAH